MPTDKALEARLNDIQDQLNHLFKLHGPARWEHILKQRRENAKASIKAPIYATERFGRPKQGA